MDVVKLPIDVVPGTSPPIFRWSQVVDTPSGKQVVGHEGPLPPAVEVAVERIVSIAKQLLYDNAALQGRIDGLIKRSEENVASPPPAPSSVAVSSSRKGRG